MLCSHSDKGEILAFNCPKKIIDKENLIFNEDMILKQNGDKLDKLFQLTEKVLFTSFLTLPVKEMEDKQQASNIIKSTWNEIYKSWEDTFKIKRLQQIYRCSQEKAELLQQEKIQHYAELDAKIWIESQIKKAAFYNIADKYKKRFSHIKTPKLRKQREEDFKFKHKEEIEQEFNSIYQKEFNSRWLETGQEKINELTFRISHQINEEFYSFQVTEPTKSDTPHLHILLNHYIPSSLIKRSLSSDVNEIFDNKSLIYNFISDNKNESLFFNCDSISQKYDKFSELMQTGYSRTLFVEGVVNYMGKYMGKDSLKTYEWKHKYNVSAHLSRFSQKLSRDFPEIFAKEKTGLKFMTFFNQTLRKYSHTLKDNFNPQDILKRELTEQELQNTDYLKGLKARYFKDILTKQGFFDVHQNQPYMDIYNRLFPLIRKFQENFDLENEEIQEILEQENLENQDLSKQLLKLINSNCLEYIYKNSKSQKGKFSPKTLDLINNSDLSDFKKDTFFNILQNPISLLKGSAGTGKSYLLSHLNYLREDFQLVYLTAKNIPKKELKEKVEERGFKENEIYCETLSKYLEKRGKNFFINASNCRKSEDKPVFLIIDEIGQINFEELNSLFQGVHLDSISHILFAGDDKQDKSFVGNSLIYDLEQINFIKSFDLGNESFRQQTASTQNIVNSFLKQNKFLGIDKIFNFYKNEELLREKISYLIQNNYIMLSNSKKLRNHLNKHAFDLAKELNLEIPLIADKNFLVQRDKISNGERFVLLSEQKEFVKLKRLSTNSEFILTISMYNRYIKPCFSLTIDKVQGLGFDNVAVFYDSYAKENLATKTKYYTAISRAKFELKIYLEREELRDQILNSKNQNIDLIRFNKYQEIEQFIKIISVSQNFKTPSDRLSEIIKGIRKIYK